MFQEVPDQAPQGAEQPKSAPKQAPDAVDALKKKQKTERNTTLRTTATQTDRLREDVVSGQIPGAGKTVEALGKVEAQMDKVEKTLNPLFKKLEAFTKKFGQMKEKLAPLFAGFTASLVGTKMFSSLRKSIAKFVGENSLYFHEGLKKNGITLPKGADKKQLIAVVESAYQSNFKNNKNVSLEDVFTGAMKAHGKGPMTSASLTSAVEAWMNEKKKEVATPSTEQTTVRGLREGNNEVTTETKFSVGTQNIALTKEHITIGSKKFTFTPAPSEVRWVYQSQNPQALEVRLKTADGTAYRRTVQSLLQYAANRSGQPLQINQFDTV